MNARITEIVVATPVCQVARQPVEGLLQELGHDRLANRAKRQAGQRDPELDRGDEPRWIVQEVEHAPRAPNSLRLQFLQAGAAHRHEGIFCGNEERVRRNDHHHSQKLGGDQHGLGTSSLKLKSV